ncbi:DUF1080 domain-containing protein [Sesbania bispinosa]|nr:DUF1080 domain-containing protein [Sesbania bispinosa]
MRQTPCRGLRSTLHRTTTATPPASALASSSQPEIRSRVESLPVVVDMSRDRLPRSVSVAREERWE